MGRVRRSTALDSVVTIPDRESIHRRSSSSPTRQPSSRKKPNPVSALEATIVDAIGPSDQQIHRQHPPTLNAPRANLLYPFDLSGYDQTEINYSEPAINDARPSTPGGRRKRAHRKDQINPKRMRELKNEQNAREKKTAAEAMLIESRAAFPREYRAFVETEVPDRFGPRTREIAGENLALDSKMFIADVMARSAVSLGHLNLILKHNGLDVLEKAIAMEKKEQEEKKSREVLAEGPLPSNPTEYLSFPFFPSSGQGPAELIPESFEFYELQSLMTPLSFEVYPGFQTLESNSNV